MYVFEGRVNDRDRDQHFHERTEPRALRGETESRAEQRDRVRQGEAGDDRKQRAHATERNDEAEHEQQMIEAGQDVLDAEPDKSACRTESARIEIHSTRSAAKQESAALAARTDEAHRELQADLSCHVRAD